MIPTRLIPGVLAVVLGLAAVPTAAPASEDVYTYSIHHPLFGEIGTFTDRIERVANQTRIRTTLRVAVRLLGIVAYQEEADGTEVLHGGRLVSLKNVGNRDGDRFEVEGQARGGEFVVTSAHGSVTAPATVSPSDPWLLRGPGQGLVVSTRSGQVVPVTVAGGELVTIDIRGVSVRARHFVVTGDKHQEVWMSEDNVPVMFRSIEDSTPIDFILRSPLPVASGRVAAAPRATIERSDR